MGLGFRVSTGAVRVWGLGGSTRGLEFGGLSLSGTQSCSSLLAHFYCLSHRDSDSAGGSVFSLPLLLLLQATTEINTIHITSIASAIAALIKLLSLRR